MDGPTISSQDQIPARHLLIVFAAIAALTALAYWPGLNGPWLLDDQPVLFNLIESTQQGESLSTLIDLYIVSNTGPLGRPVAMASFIVNSAVSGDTVAQWKTVNLLIHLLNGILVYFLLSRTLALCAAGRISSSRIALLATAFWLLNPLQLSTVFYVVQRMTLLATTFSLISLIGYLDFRSREAAGAKKRVALIVTILAFFAALFSKETALILPALYLLLECFCFSGLHRLSSFYRTARGKIMISSVALGCAALGFWVLSSYMDRYEIRPFTLTERLLTEARIVFLYIYQWILPVPSNLGFFHDDITVSTGLLSPVSTIFSLFGIGFLLTSIFLFFRRAPWISFAIAWFLTNHLIESSVIPLELMFEHRNYIPSIGIALVAASSIDALFVSSRLRFAVSFATIFLFIALLAMRANIWSDEQKLFANALRHHPDSLSLVSTNANLLLSKGSIAEAIDILSARNTPETALHLIYIDCLLNKETSASNIEAATALIAKPTSSYLLTGAIKLANLGLDDQCTIPHGAFDNLLATGIAASPKRDAHYKLRLYRAHWTHKGGNLDEAIKQLADLADYAPDDPIPLLLQSEWLLESGQKEAAKSSFQTGSILASKNSERYRTLMQDLHSRLYE